LFPSGSRDLLPQAIPVLVDLSRVFAHLPNRLKVEGFTDDEAINTAMFPSNWELSASRAAAVVRLFEANGVEPSRMSATGYGEYQPLASNSSAEGRARNRRVVVVVMSSVQGREREPLYDLELSTGP